MVQENTTLSQDRQPDSPSDGLPPLEIEDNTSPEVLQQEEQFLAGEDSSRDVVDADEGISAEEPGIEATPPETDQQTQPVPEPSFEAEQEPSTEQHLQEQPRTFTQEEVSKMQSAFDRQMAEQNKRLKQLEETARTQSVDNQVEATLQQQEASLAQQYGAEDARRIVRDANNVKAVRDAAEARSQLQAIQAERDQFASQSRMGVMNNWIGQLRQQHSLTDTDVQALHGLASTAINGDENMFVSVGESLGQLAARLAANGQQRTAADEERKKFVPRETPETALESGQSISPAPPSIASIRERARNKMSYEWTDEERNAMRNVAGV